MSGSDRPGERGSTGFENENVVVVPCWGGRWAAGVFDDGGDGAVAGDAI
jgi:hypothetical protein